MSKIVKIKLKNGEERIFHDVEVQSTNPNSWRLTLLAAQSGEVVFQSDKADIERWEIVQTPG